MRHSLLLLLASMLVMGIGTAFAQQGTEDVIYLKNGSVIRGVIIEQVPNSSVKIKTIDGSEFAYPISDVIKITREAPLQKPSVTLQRKKSPAVAFGLSFLFPGLGQYYNGGTGNIVKGLIQSGTFVGGAVLAFHYGQDTNYQSGCIAFDQFGNCTGYYSFAYQQTSNKYYAGAGMMVGAAAWSMIDAPLSARSINRKAQTAAHMIELKHGDNVIGFDVTPTGRKGFGAQISYQFR